MQPQPLDVEKAPKAIERVDVTIARMTDVAAHPCVALEAIATVNGEDEDDGGGMTEGFVELLLVLPLRSPKTVPH